MQILGIHIDKPFVRAALLQKGRSGIKMSCLKTALLSNPGNVKQLYMPSFKGRLASGLSSHELLLRPVELKIASNRYIDEALALQSENISYFNASDVLSVSHTIRQEKDWLKAYLCAVSRESLRAHLQELRQLQLEPDCVSSNCLAQIQYAMWKDPTLTNAFLVDLGSSEWTCTWMENGELKKSHSLKGGLEALLSALWEDRKKILLPKEVDGAAKQIDLIQLKPNLNPRLSEKLDELRQELAKTICSFYRTAKQQPIFFTGHIDAFGSFRQFLLESLKEMTSHKSSCIETATDLKFAIPIGLALEQTHRPLQLLQEEFFPKKNWRKAGLYASLLSLASLMIGASILLFGNLQVEKRQQKLLSCTENLLKQWNLEIKGKALQDPAVALDQWTKAVSAHSKEYSYILQAPKVSEVLAWLNHHPLQAEFQEAGDHFQIENFRYQLTDYPKIGSPKSCYRAKIELEFHLQSSAHARKFHEALLAEKNFIDQSKDISWETIGDSYRLGFHLKNHKVPYVP